MNRFQDATVGTHHIYTWARPYGCKPSWTHGCSKALRILDNFPCDFDMDPLGYRVDRPNWGVGAVVESHRKVESYVHSNVRPFVSLDTVGWVEGE